MATKSKEVSRRSGRQRYDLSGKRFGSWIVVRFSEKRESGSLYWLCRCDCGLEKAVAGSSLLCGDSNACKSCAYTKHGHARKYGPRSRTYSIWQSMLTRCGNPKAIKYHRYGGRGIRVCKRWLNSFDNFLSDMGECPAGCELDRIDNDGNYSPVNCRWTTRYVNTQNTIRTKLNTEAVKVFRFFKDRVPTRLLADLYGLKYQTVRAAQTGRSWSNV